MLDYFDALFQGLVVILPIAPAGVKAFTFMLVGIFIGFWVGILPGLGGAATLALMLPFIYQMEPVSAFAFLLGSNAVTATTGDITSVLFGVPGEGTTAATVVDGHAMAKKGEAGRALGAALMSSLIGAIFGALLLALAIPIVQPLVLSIGAGEFFMLAILGITFVASVSGSNLLKGITAGAFGLILATIGLDPIASVPRFTLESIIGVDASLFFWDGISLIVVTVGLFAIPEIIDLVVQGTSIAREKVEKIGGVLQGVKDTFRHGWLVLRCSAIGAYIGLLPGLGGGAAQWVAYAHAVQSSPDKERFGKGAVEGVLGPGAANNSKEGGSLIPTIAFGVPGSVSMAILLGAFIIQGITPGPDMLDPDKFLTLTFSFVWLIVLANVITVAVCFLFLGQLVRITYIKGTYLVPFILLLVFMGGFTEKNDIGDIALVLFFGALGWLMVQFNWPRPPLLLGLVLGDIAEANFFIASGAYGAGWVLQPGVLVIGCLIIAAFAYSIYQVRKQKHGENIVSDVELEIILRNPVYAALFSLALAAAFLYVVREGFFGFGVEFPRAAFFPRLIGIVGLVLSLTVFASDFYKTFRLRGAVKADVSRLVIAQRRALAMAGWIIGLFASVWVLGFNLTALLGTFLYLKLGARERWAISLILAVVAWGFFYGLFDRSLHLPVPRGIGWKW